MGTVMDSMNEAVKGRGALKAISRVSGMLEKLKTLDGEASAAREGLEKARSEISAKEREISSLEEKASAVAKSGEWKEMDRLDRRIRECRGSLESIEADVSGRLGSMKRVFKLYAHDAADLGKEERKLVMDLSHSPLKAFLSGDPGRITNVLERLDSDIRSGEFRLSEKDAGKTGELKEMLESGFVSGARARHDAARKEEAAASGEREGIKVGIEKKKSERALEKARAELEMLRRRASGLEKAVEEKDGEMESRKKEIAGFVKDDLGPDVELE
jgi:hypothetical protein